VSDAGRELTVAQCTEADLDRVYKVNVKGVYNCSLNAVSAMKAAGIKGSIVNLASIASIVSQHPCMISITRHSRA
jgi:NAD(P)-dependent dehydrogenase (short-subunit alcohol dehydrogenase family)